MLYKVIKGRINGKAIGEIVDLKEEIGRAYGVEYVIPIEEKKEEKKEEKTEPVSKFGNVYVQDLLDEKDLTDIENKALTSKRGRRKGAPEQNLYPC